jgi:hypothetical protein
MAKESLISSSKMHHASKYSSHERALSVDSSALPPCDSASAAACGRLASAYSSAARLKSEAT